MAKALVPYDKDLPEITGRIPWERPSSFLVKDSGSKSGWREDKSGRRPSDLLLVEKIREGVDAWRSQGYPGASEVSLRLFHYWFEEDHEVPGFASPFRYYFCQREAIETLIWLIEIAKQTDTERLIKEFGVQRKENLFDSNFRFQTSSDKRRQLVRVVSEKGDISVEELPPVDLRRFAFKLATGSGKTWVMAMAIVWSHFHKKMVTGSNLSTNALIVAPNVIVYQRLEKDFGSNRIFYTLPLVPPEWGKFSPKVILRGESTDPDASGNLFLTNIHQLYESRDAGWTPLNAVESLLGRKPSKDLANSGQRSMLERVKSLRDVIVLNDEAHHVHDEDLAWSQSLLAINSALPNGINAWLDFSATPKYQTGMYYPWTVCDYPLAQAVEDRIVKAPIIITREKDDELPKKEPEKVNKDNVVQKYAYWLRAAVERWKAHSKVYKKLGKKPILFIVVEKSTYADKIGEFLWKTREFGFKQSEVLVIHTNTSGDITEGDLELARQAARDMDNPESPYKAIVSVMMLKEGWDVKNVSVVLGLRPFKAASEILPEQVIGRGLRLMTDVTPDRTQTLEVLGTKKLLAVLRDQLEAEGVGVGVSSKGAIDPVVIAPIQEKAKYDIEIPLTRPQLVHNVRKLNDLDQSTLEPLYDQKELNRYTGDLLRMEFATTNTEVGQQVIAEGELASSQEYLGIIASKVVEQARLPNRFAEVYPIVRNYVTECCFGKNIDVESPRVRARLSQFEIREAIANYLTRRLSEITVERRDIEFERKKFRLSLTKPFTWRRDLPPLECTKTTFNFVATYNSFERAFARFLDEAKDVKRFASLGTTQQGESGSQFRVDYLKPNGAIGFYHPDWVVVQKTDHGDVNWIIETKGRVWEGTTDKDNAIEVWCSSISVATKSNWKYKRVNQADFERIEPRRLADLVVDPNPTFL
jgi:type III restriction enzyme